MRLLAYFATYSKMLVVQGRVAQLAARAKKNVVGKAATSALGKKAIKAKAPGA